MGSKNFGAAEVARAACNIVAALVAKSDPGDGYERKRAVVFAASPFVAQTNLSRVSWLWMVKNGCLTLCNCDLSRRPATHLQPL
jgi:hypothetical protein